MLWPYDYVKNSCFFSWYRAPELALSMCEYTDQMDVWSFGCILAECLTGKPLFPSKTALDQA